MRRSHPRTRTQPMLASERSGGARLSTMRTTIVRVMADLATLHTRPPFDCGLRSVSMTRSTMSLQGQAEQPMVLRGRSVSSMVPDAPVPWPWTRVAGRVWFAAGQSGSMRSRTSAQLCGMLAWWAPRHAGVAVARQWKPSAGRTGRLARSAAGYAPWARSGAGGATADFRLFGEVPGRGECPAPAPFTRSKRQIPRAKGPVRPSEGF